MIDTNQISTCRALFNLTIFVLLLFVSASHADELEQDIIRASTVIVENHLMQFAFNANQDSSTLQPDSGKNFKPTPARILTTAQKLAALDGKYVWDKSKYYLKIKLSKGVLSLEKYTKHWRHAGRECTFPRNSHICTTRSPKKEYTLSEFGIQKKQVVSSCAVRSNFLGGCAPGAGLSSQTLISDYSFQN